MDDRGPRGARSAFGFLAAALVALLAIAGPGRPLPAFAQSGSSVVTGCDGRTEGDATPGYVAAYAADPPILGDATPSECWHDTATSGASGALAAALEWVAAASEAHWTLVVGPGAYEAPEGPVDLSQGLSDRHLALLSAPGAGALPAIEGSLALAHAAQVQVGEVGQGFAIDARDAAAPALAISDPGAVVVAGNEIEAAAGYQGILIDATGAPVAAATVLDNAIHQNGAGDDSIAVHIREVAGTAEVRGDEITGEAERGVVVVGADGAAATAYVEDEAIELDGMSFGIQTSGIDQVTVTGNRVTSGPTSDLLAAVDAGCFGGGAAPSDVTIAENDIEVQGESAFDGICSQETGTLRVLGNAVRGDGVTSSAIWLDLSVSSGQDVVVAGNTVAPSPNAQSFAAGYWENPFLVAANSLCVLDFASVSSVSDVSVARAAWNAIGTSGCEVLNFSDGDATRTWWGDAGRPADPTFVLVTHGAEHAPWVYGFRLNAAPGDVGPEAGRTLGSTAEIGVRPAVLLTEDGETVSQVVYLSDLRESDPLASDWASLVNPYIRLGYRVHEEGLDPGAGWIVPSPSSDDALSIPSPAQAGDYLYDVALLVGSPYAPVPLGEPETISLRWEPPSGGTGGGGSAGGGTGGVGAGGAGEAVGGSEHSFVGVDGGTVTSTDGVLSVTLPATPEGGYSTTVSVVSGEGPAPPPGTGRVLVAGRVYEVDVTDAQGRPVHDFRPPYGPLVLACEIALASLPEGADPRGLAIWYWDDVLRTWVPVATEVAVDEAAGTVRLTALVDHLTTFAVFTGGAPIPPDVTGTWAEDEVLRLLALGAVSGYEDGTFRPDRLVTRAEWAKLLVGSLGLALPDEATAQADLTAAFVDAASIPAWAGPYVVVAVARGYLEGVPASGGLAFLPGAAVRRDEATLALARVLEADGLAPPADGLPFRDAPAIPLWARYGVAEASAVGLVTGYPDGTFRPDAPLTRAQAAVVLVRLLEWRAAGARS